MKQDWDLTPKSQYAPQQKKKKKKKEHEDQTEKE